ncbi:hypothetical protein [Aporhodopirellula aestuarii]|uniref:Uncharacterized protein n=1 Tax=Aporhodopirellula aestuarii TaxID=2950107 RepID=A0ABT0U0I9_9BACT|nr:hypothetical protein [Aporhodopirellula aestuarii]MCM2370387.1 hypothetical protein [Aporhodopirellula aestuarii]
MDETLDIIIGKGGTARMVYHEAFDARCLGHPTIRRGSEVEPTADGRWTADLARVGGPRLGPFTLRSQAITAEVDWLRRFWLERDVSNFNINPNPGEVP